jgi:meso-butanediol dehydrogenase / (S,S)-butanediol dehydrogenase / diacetyl reductase
VAGPLDGRVAIVTGGGRGIGRAIASSLAEAGCRLALCSRSGTAEEAANELAREGYEAYGQVADVARPADVREFVETVIGRYGRVDILVNNAAVNYSGSVVDMEQSSFDAIFATNVRGVFYAVQAVVPGMIARRYGKIVNIASFVARSPVPLYAAYSASKAAVVSLTRGLALELSEHDINVNAVCPGNVWSDIWESSTVELRRITGKSAQQFFDETVAKHPLGRAQTGEDVGAATVFLCSGAARNVTGEALYVTGGL